MDDGSMSGFARAVYEREAKSSTSKMDAILASMTDGDREAFDYAVSMVNADRSKPQNKRVYSVQWLTDILNQNGYEVGKTSVSEYLRKADDDAS